MIVDERKNTFEDAKQYGVEKMIIYRPLNNLNELGV